MFLEVIDPIAIRMGPLTVHWYALIIITGLLLGYLFAYIECRRRHIDPNLLIDFLFYAVPAAIIGARIYYVAFSWDKYRGHLGEIFAIWHGGIAIHGAIIGALIAAIIFTKRRNLSFWGWADLIAPSLILGQGIGRWGNFINQEAHGGAVSRAFLEHLHLPDFIIQQMAIDGVYYAPTFLYESLWDIAGFILLFLVRRLTFRKEKGDIFLGYLIWYSIGRFYVEGLRTDSLMLTTNLRMAQVISIAIILLALVLLISKHWKSFRNAEKRHEV